jgi:hypothetical protein
MTQNQEFITARFVTVRMSCRSLGKFSRVLVAKLVAIYHRQRDCKLWGHETSFAG